MSDTAGEAEAELVFAGLLRSSCERPLGGNLPGWKRMIRSKEGRIQGRMVFEYTLYAPNTTGKVNACGWHENKEHFSCANPSDSG